MLELSDEEELIGWTLIHREEAKADSRGRRTSQYEIENCKFLVAMRLGDTPVPIPNTLVKT